MSSERQTVDERFRLVMNANDQMLVDLVCAEQSDETGDSLTRQIRTLHFHSATSDLPKVLCTNELLCPLTSYMTPHSWECPYLEDPYWVCCLCGQQTDHPAGLGASQSLLTKVLPALQHGGVASEAFAAASSKNTVKVKPSRFRIQPVGGSRKDGKPESHKRPSRLLPKQPPRELRVSSRQKSFVKSRKERMEQISRIQVASREHKIRISRKNRMVSPEPDASEPDSIGTTTSDRAGRKYISKKKQQMLALLRAYKGLPAKLPAEEVVLRLKQFLGPQPATRDSVEAGLRQLNMTKYLPDLPYLVHKFTGKPMIEVDQLEPFVISDLERILTEYLKLPNLEDSSKRRPLDCSYLLYQLLRNRGVANSDCELLLAKDKPSRSNHDEVYSSLARTVGLQFFPVQNLPK